MSKAIAIFTGGITELRQAAVRKDGTVFSRAQVNDPRFGRSWSSWSATGTKVDDVASIDAVQIGFASLRKASVDDCFINNRALFNDNGDIRVRLP